MIAGVVNFSIMNLAQRQRQTYDTLVRPDTDNRHPVYYRVPCYRLTVAPSAIFENRDQTWEMSNLS
jgi:hypothetical protein